MSSDLKRELQAISDAVKALEPLSHAERMRVILWLGDYFSHHDEDEKSDVSLGGVVASDETYDETSYDGYAEDDAYGDYEDELAADGYEGGDEYDAAAFAGDDDEDDDDVADSASEGFSSFGQFYDFVAPKTARQKIATAAWWLEDEGGLQSWKTYDITKALKEIGQPLRYISTTIAQEQKREDPLVERLSKSGESMQAHGAFRLTQFGRAFVEGRLGE